MLTNNQFLLKFLAVFKNQKLYIWLNTKLKLYKNTFMFVRTWFFSRKRINTWGSIILPHMIKVMECPPHTYFNFYSYMDFLAVLPYCWWLSFVFLYIIILYCAGVVVILGWCWFLGFGIFLFLWCSFLCVFVRLSFMILLKSILFLNVIFWLCFQLYKLN